MAPSSSIFFALLLLTVSAMTNGKKRKIIIDSDGGVNDAFALIWALQSLGDKLIEIEALTTVKSDLSSYDAFRNVILMVNITKRSKMRKQFLSIPIAKAPTNTDEDNTDKTDDYDVDEDEDGRPFINDGLYGFSGMLQKYPDIFCTKKKTSKAFETASFSDDLLIETILKHPNQISLITTGALTNLYLAELKHPGIISIIKEIYILGGVFSNGSGNSKNCSLSEFNFNYDSNALYELLNGMNGNLPNIFIFPLDTSHQMEFGLKQISLLYTLLNTDIQTEIEMCRMKMEKDEENEEDPLYDDSDLFDSVRDSEDEDYDDLFCTQTALLYFFYEKMMEAAIRDNYFNGYCSCLQMADSSIIGYLLYPHLYDFKYVNCRVNKENGMIWYDSRLDVIKDDTITIPNCFVNVAIDVDKVMHGFTRDSVHMMHEMYMDYMEYVMDQMEW